jgi:hypothetical protein
MNNICVGFADVAHTRRESGAYDTQILRPKFAYGVRHVCPRIMQTLRAPAAQQGMFLLKPSYLCFYVSENVEMTQNEHEMNSLTDTNIF